MRLFRPFILYALLLLAYQTSFAQNFSLSQYLNVQYARRPSFVAAGTDLLYISNISGVPEVWKIPAAGGYYKQVSFDTNGVSGAWCSPVDPRIMIASADVGGSEKTQLYLASPYGSPWFRLTKDDAAIYSFGCWARDGSRFAYATNMRNKKDFDIYEYILSEDRHALLYQGEGMNTAEDYSPDGLRLLITHTSSASNGDILMLKRESSKITVKTPHTGEVSYGSPRWNFDGSGFYFLTDRDREFTYLAFTVRDSMSFVIADTAQGDIEQFAFSNDSTYLAWSVNENGYSRFHMRNLKDDTHIGPARIPQGVIQNMLWSPDGSRLVFTLAGGDRAQDIWIYHAGQDQLVQLTVSATGGIPRESFLAPTLVNYPTFDGRSIPAWWYAPAKQKGKMPVIVLIHGGPEAQARPNLSGLNQYFLSLGYGILEPNIRGSAGFGKTYESLDNVRLRPDALQDIDYAARWLKQRSDVDTTKMAIYGGSYGGFAVLAALTTYPGTWAAGVSIVGIANFVTFLENTGIYRRVNREAEYGSLEKDRDFLTSISPINHVENIRAPLFLIQGANDPRVPKTEAEQMAAAIRARGGIVQYLLFEDEGHGLTKTKNRLTAYAAVADFLQKYCGR